MSGGYFEYRQYHIQDIIEKLEETKVKIENDEEYFRYKDKDLLLEDISNTIDYFDIAQVYLHRLDWLFSGDDGEDTYFKNLDEDIANYLENQELELEKENK